CDRASASNDLRAISESFWRCAGSCDVASSFWAFHARSRWRRPSLKNRMASFCGFMLVDGCGIEGTLDAKSTGVASRHRANAGSLLRMGFSFLMEADYRAVC